ncbi:MAG: hypothetical protein IPO73_00345 [Gemmatimonadetes bacterium]|nr:hypothetical protein [Gemmatimonadota bacterium]
MRPRALLRTLVTDSRVRTLATILAAAVIAACGGGESLNNPPGGTPTAIAIIGGGGQSATVAAPLPDTLVVRVTDAAQEPVVGRQVVFRAIAGGSGAQLIPDTAVTDVDGRARSRWVLGQLAGSQRVEARVVGAASLVATFDATGLAGAADTVFALSGDGQAAGAGAALAESLVVVVTDGYGNPVAGQAVLWAATGGGSVSDDTTATGADGHVAVRRTLGPVAGAQGATATAAGLAGSPVSFSHTATPVATGIVRVAGDSQSAALGAVLPESLVVRVVDAQGHGVAGKNLSWIPSTGSGAAAPRTAVTDSLGEARTQWTLGTLVGTRTLTVLVPGVGQTDFTATVLAGAPDSVAAVSVLAQNGAAGLPVGTSPAVRVFDAGGNPIAGASVVFRVTQGGGAVSNGAVTDTAVTVVADSLGVARVTAWILGPGTGANAVEASVPPGPVKGSPVSFTATASAGPAAKLAIVVQPADTSASGTVLPRQPEVQVQDAGGNPVNSGGRQVTATLVGTGSLRGVRTVTTGATGLATYLSLDILGLAGSYRIAVASTGLTPDTSAVIVLTPGAAARLGLLTQPSASGASGLPFAQQPVVQVQDSAGNPVAQGGITVGAVLATGTGTLLGTTSVVSLASGAAPFTDLAIAGTPGARTIGFSAAGLSGVVSSTVQIGAGAPTTIAVAVQPSATARSGVALATQPVVQLRDSTGNNVALPGIAITANVSAGGTLAGTVTVNTNASGAAPFTGLALIGAAGDYTLSFTSPGLTTGTSNVVALGAGLPAQLTLAVPVPAAAQSGLTFTTAPVLQLRDSVGNPLAQSGVTIVASLASGAGGNLRGTLQVPTDAAGQATFGNLNLFGPIGSYTLRFAGNAASSIDTLVATPTTLSAGVAAKLLLSTAPSAVAQNNVALAQQPVVTVADSANNPVLVAGTQVTAAVATGAPALVGTVTVPTSAAGVATFSGLTLVGAVGNRTLGFSSGTLTGVVSGTIVVSAGAARTIALNAGDNQTAGVGQPVAIPPSVLVTDTTGNPVAGVNVTFAVTLGGGSVANPNAVTGAGGIASAGSWTLGPVAGADSLSATAAGLTGSPVRFGATAAAGAAVRLTVTTEPSASAASGTPLATQPVVQLLDANGNPVGTAGRAITATLLGGGAQLRGTRTINTVAGGSASYSGLDLFGTAGTYTIAFTAAGLVPDTSLVIVLGPGAAARLAMSQQPSTQVVSGVAFPLQPAVRVQDSSGNAVSQAGVAVTAAVGTGSGTLGGTLTVNTQASGIATFSGLSLTGAPGGHTLAFSAPGLIGVSSGGVTVGAGSATALAIINQPSATARSGVAFGAQPTVQLRDASGTNVAQAGVPVTLAASAGGTVRGIATITTNGNGLAVFNGLAVSGVVGSYTLTATSAGLTPATTAAIALTPGLPSALTFVTTPSAAAANGLAFAQQPALQLRDDAGNAVSQAGVTVQATVLTGAGGILRGGVSVTSDAAGVATYAGLNLFGDVGGYTIKFDGGPGGALVPLTSGTITLGNGPAARMLLSTAPSAAIQNGVAFPQQPVLSLADSSDNPVAQAGVQVTATLGSGTGVLAGTVTATTNGSGVATFTGLRIVGTPGNRSLTFLGNGLQNLNSGTLSLTAGPARTIALNGGNNQAALVGQSVTTSPTVLVTDTTGNPVSGVSVSWAVTVGNGAVGTPSAVTGVNGIASAGGWTLGTTAGFDSLSATAAGLAGSPVHFGATVNPAGTGQLAIITQPSATVASGVAFAQQPVLELQDPLGTPLTTSGVPVTAVITGSSFVGTVTVNTVNGVASFTDLGLSGLAGSHAITFEAPGFTGATATPTTITAGPAARLLVETEPAATARSGITLTEQPVVRVTDLAGNPTPAAASVSALILSGGGTLLGTTTVSTGGGSTASFTNLGISGTVGARTLLFTTSGLGSDTSTAIVVAAGTPAVITASSSTAQNGTVRRTVGTPPAVLVEDAAGNPVSGVTVTFAVTGGGGSLNGATQVTGAGGVATVGGWTLGSLVGAQTVSATASGGGISGNPVSFTATAAAATATDLALSAGNGQSATVGTAVAVAPAVLVSDAFGNPVAGVTVTFAIGSGGGSLTGASAVSNASGIATVGSWTLGNLAGVNTLTASAAGLGGSPVGFTATATAGAAATITKQGGDNQVRTVNGAVPVAPFVRVTDGSGNPVAGVAVTFAVASGGGSLTGASATTNASGIATVGSWTLGTAAGSNTLTATAAGLAGSPLTFTATGVAGAANAAQSSATVPGGSKGSQTTITIQLRDQFGNVLAAGGANVQVTITGANPGAAAVTDLGDGTYLAGYVPAASGTDLVSITLNGVQIGGSPYTSSIP